MYLQSVPDIGKSCSDGVFCNGEEKCNASGQCAPGAAVDCSAAAFGGIHPQCGRAFCSEQEKACKVCACVKASSSLDLERVYVLRALALGKCINDLS